MRSKSYKVSVNILFVALIIIANISFLSLPVISDLLAPVASYHNKKLVFFFVVASLGYLAVTRRSFRYDITRIDRSNSYANYLKYYFVQIIITILVSAEAYPQQSLRQIVGIYYYQFVFLLFFPLIYFMKRYKGYYNKVINLIIAVGTIYALYSLVTALLFQISGVPIMSVNTTAFGERNGLLRLSQTADMTSLSCVLAYAMWRSPKSTWKRKRYLWSFIICLFCTIFVGQSRVYSLACVVACVFSYMICEKVSKTKIFIVFTGIMMFGALLPYLFQFIQSFSLSNVESMYYYSSYMRASGYRYFLSRFFDNMVIGFGYPANDLYRSVLTGGGVLVEGGWKVDLALSDMGYIGYLGMYGVLGVMALFFLFKIIAEDLFYYKKHRIMGEYIEAFALFVYVAISYTSMIFNDVQRSVYFPIVLSLFSYNHIQSHAKK